MLLNALIKSISKEINQSFSFSNNELQKMYIPEIPLTFSNITEATCKKTFERVLVSLQGLINISFSWATWYHLVLLWHSHVNPEKLLPPETN